MTKYREILRLDSMGFSQRNIAASCSVSRNTVATVLQRAKEVAVSWQQAAQMEEAELQERLFSKKTTATNRCLPDYGYIRSELARKGVTKTLLWVEYCEKCRAAGQEPLMYSQFCYYIQKNEEKHRATMHIPRKPAEYIEVDWAGDPAKITDPHTGRKINAWLFVGVLPYSQYTFVKAYADEKKDNWLKAHVQMFEFFGGVTPMLVPDNCSTAVTHSKSDICYREINVSYRELAEHYNTAVIPARIRKPKDKAAVESSVGKISTWITAALRDGQFFSLEELNRAIAKKLEEYNKRPFQKKQGSRLSMFLEEEKPLLLPLPAARFELAEWRQATVQFNYHIAVDKMFYSVPFQYIRNRVDVRMTETLVEIFAAEKRIASHKRLYGRSGQYSTVKEHMPETHLAYLEWDGERFRKWARNIGEHTFRAIDAMLASGKIEQQSYRSCMALLKLSDSYSPAVLEKACEKALLFRDSPSYRNIKSILDVIVAGHKNLSKANPCRSLGENRNIAHGIVRGADYYGGNR